MEKKEWIEEVLNSTQKLQRAEAPEGLWHKVEARVKNEAKVIALVPTRTIWLAAASIGVLVVLNWFALRSYRETSERVSPVESLIEQYQLN
ncbi:hypothetical protein [Runella slithyformis]|uniref:Uncharacterized protein n=1 Tax=Runella slithyformis (strain ATCC 29530 / DSM 19594 / LMG 11500 / NCIMB 11436 / LSU 4) TaxID=761193 RepID=A0A7U3ZIJ9_RUNSL|nr:hypothetical protein [Runella slithyformis]AEI47882.1 hypothetical protein Runsl_1456 [Runella slithyformis DSM 19594]